MTVFSSTWLNAATLFHRSDTAFVGAPETTGENWTTPGVLTTGSSKPWMFIWVIEPTVSWVSETTKLPWGWQHSWRLRWSSCFTFTPMDDENVDFGPPSDLARPSSLVRGRGRTWPLRRPSKVFPLDFDMSRPNPRVWLIGVHRGRSTVF